MWADRILHSNIATQLLRDGHADQARLEAIADVWRTWPQDPDGWLTLVHGEVLLNVGP